MTATGAGWMRRDSRAVDLVVGIVAETEKALLVTVTGYGADATWVPKALIEIGERRTRFDDPADCRLGVYEATMPAWKAIAAGLVDPDLCDQGGPGVSGFDPDLTGPTR